MDHNLITLLMRLTYSDVYYIYSYNYNLITLLVRLSDFFTEGNTQGKVHVLSL